MRDYSKVCPSFWSSDIVTDAQTGDSSEMLVALYVTTAPASNTLGLYRCPLPLLAHDTRMTIEQASRAIDSLSARGFLEFDSSKSIVYVKKMALHQIEKELKAGDKRVVYVKRELESCASQRLKRSFINDYNELFNLGFDADISPSDAPSDATILALLEGI